MESEAGPLWQAPVIEVLERHWLVEVYAPSPERLFNWIYDACVRWAADGLFVPC